MTDQSQNLMIPPRKMAAQDGVFAWPEAPVLLTPRLADECPLSQLAHDLKTFAGVRARIRQGAAGRAALRIVRRPNVQGIDGFRAGICPDGITIEAATDAAVYYGIQLIRDLVRLHERSIPACNIQDRADFERRAVYLDCSRGKVPTADTMKGLVEHLAAWRINELQIYVENVFAFKRHPAISRGFSPFTIEDILEVQEYAKQHHVRLVPSLATFGHLATVLGLPAYRHLGELPDKHRRTGGNTLCPGDPGSLRLMADLFDEFLPLFEAEDFNLCGDETWQLGKGRSKSRADRIGISRVYIGFIKKLHRLVEKHGKRTNMWADIILKHPEDIGLVPRDIVMLNWDYAPRGPRFKYTRNIAEAGFAHMVCPGTSGWQTHGTLLADSMQNVANFVAIARRHGAEGVLNTDWGDSGHRNTLGVSLHGLAHAAAHAWNGRKVDDDTFTARFCARVYGDTKGKLASAVRLLGQSIDSAQTRLYHALVEPICAKPGSYLKGINARSPVWMSNAHPRQDIAEGDPAGLRKVASQLSGKALWPKLSGLDPFEKTSFAELQLAARMDALAARRALVARKLREGKSVPAPELRALGDEMRDMTREFKRLWLARNKPSRLKDNLTLLNRASEEVSKLARQHTRS